MGKLNTVVVGLGHQAVQDHIPSILDSSNHQLVGVCDIDEAKVHSLAKEYNTNGFSSIDTMIKDLRIDVAVVIAICRLLRS
jgi:predicted dehydrogenase